jgi:putative ABC transport system permease protein
MSWGGTLDQMGFSSTAPPVSEVLATYNVSLDTTTVALFFAISITTVLVATILPMLYIVRLNPKKIML